jgi:hypothetical protein
MEDNTILETVGADSSDVLTDESRAAIDSLWGDDPGDDYSWGPDADDADEQTEATEEDGGETAEDGETGEEPETAEAEESTETEPEPETEKPDEAGNQRFKLKFLGQEKEVDLDEMTTLAQKGADYDHVRTDRDSLRTENEKLKGYESFVQELAQSMGNVSAEELMESTRANLLMQKAKGEGREMSMSEARTEVRSKAREKASAQAQPDPEAVREQEQRAAIERFQTLYPNVKSDDIPASVWQEANEKNDLVAPYQKYLAQKENDEVAKLKAEIAQLKNNNKNKERSTGSRKTAGATTSKTEVDEAWEAAVNKYR